ncbi:MAG: type II toxin-antitoxin system HicB family antitoxin [Patescibacteria group bacterium]
MKKTRVFTAIYKKVKGGYSAWIEEMPNVISEGKTRKEAERNIKDALALMLETNFIMSMKDATGEIERSSIKVAA